VWYYECMAGEFLNNFLNKNEIEHQLRKQKPEQRMDSALIEQKLIRAKAIFSTFLHTKIGNVSLKNVEFTLPFNGMIDTLELSRIPQSLIQDEMDRIVLSAPGMAKSKTGYFVADPELLYKNFGPGSTERKIIEYLSANKNAARSAEEIINRLDLVAGTTVFKCIKKLIHEGKVQEIIEEPEDFFTDRRKSKKRFKII
jgi:hypothetical protein